MGRDGEVVARDRWRRRAAWYLVAQAAAVVAWWLALARSPSVRERFELAAGDRDVLTAFLIADLVVIAAGSVVAARGVAREHRRPGVALGFVGGALWYATLYLSLWVAMGRDGWWGVVPMVGASVLTSAIAVRFG